MNSHPSLNDEKQALLARMQESRGAYQRMLLDKEEKTRPLAQDPPLNTFPKSKTIGWIRDHPYLTLLGLATVVLVTRPAPRHATSQAARSLLHKGNVAASAFSRNHQAIRTALGIATMVARAVAQRRHR